MATYNIYQNGDKIETGIEEKTFTIEGLSPNTEYEFQVSAENSAGESELTEKVTITTDYSDVEEVDVSPKNNNLDVGETRDLKAEVTPSTAKQDTSWSSSDEEIATVDSNGKVEAVAEGEATIIATADGVKGAATVNVTVPVVNVESVELSPNSVDLEVDETQELEATVKPSDADDKSVSFSSNDEEVATVDSDGVVTAVSEGEATITVTTNDGDHTATTDVNVTETEEEDPEEDEG